MSRVSPNAGQAENGNPGDGTPSEPADQLTGNGNADAIVGADDSSAPSPLEGLASMPDVQAHAIAAAGEAQKTAKAANTQYPGFDPNIHAVDASGAPIKNKKTGEWNRKRGRGAKSFSGQSTFKAAPGAGPHPQTNGSESAVDREAKIKSTATVVSEMVFIGGKLFGGAEWEPRVDKANGIDERAMMQGAWENYFRIRGIIDVPPEVMLAIAIGGYAVPRFFQPHTKSRVQKIREWFYQYVARRRARRDSTPIDVSMAN